MILCWFSCCFYPELFPRWFKLIFFYFSRAVKKSIYLCWKYKIKQNFAGREMLRYKREMWNKNCGEKSGNMWTASFPWLIYVEISWTPNPPFGVLSQNRLGRGQLKADSRPPCGLESKGVKQTWGRGQKNWWEGGCSKIFQNYELSPSWRGNSSKWVNICDWLESLWWVLLQQYELLLSGDTSNLLSLLCHELSPIQLQNRDPRTGPWCPLYSKPSRQG